MKLKKNYYLLFFLILSICIPFACQDEEIDDTDYNNCAPAVENIIALYDSVGAFSSPDAPPKSEISDQYTQSCIGSFPSFTKWTPDEIECLSNAQTIEIMNQCKPDLFMHQEESVLTMVENSPVQNTSINENTNFSVKLDYEIKDFDSSKSYFFEIMLKLQEANYIDLILIEPLTEAKGQIIKDFSVQAYSLAEAAKPYVFTLEIVEQEGNALVYPVISNRIELIYNE